MAKLDSKKFIEYLQGKWGERKCPMCGGGPWTVQDTTFQLIMFYEGGLAVGGPVLPVVPVVCTNCGHTVLVNAIISGVVQQIPAPAREEPK